MKIEWTHLYSGSKDNITQQRTKNKKYRILYPGLVDNKRYHVMYCPIIVRAPTYEFLSKFDTLEEAEQFVERRGGK